MRKEQVSRATRTTAQELERQRRDAERDLAARKNLKPLTTTHGEGGSFSVLNPPPTKGGTAVSVAAGTAAVAVPETRTPVQTYLDEIAPASIVGRMVKFDTKGGQFFTADDDEEISADDNFVVLADQTLIGRVKFNGKGEPPGRLVAGRECHEAPGGATGRRPGPGPPRSAATPAGNRQQQARRTPAMPHYRSERRGI